MTIGSTPGWMARRTSTPDQPNRERLIDATLELIIANGGCRGVNLRQVAAKVGCAHTNAYNWFDSLEDLYWAALRRAVELQHADTVARLQAPEAAQAPLRCFLESQVLFAQENPGLYRLFWLEPLSGTPPAEVLMFLGEMRGLWMSHLGARLAELNSRTDPAWAGQIIHGYVHGEICKLIGRQAFVPVTTDDRARIVGNTLTLIDLVASGGPART